MPQTFTITADQVAAAPKIVYAKPTKFMTPYERMKAGLERLSLEGKVRPPTGRARGRGVGSQVFPRWSCLLPDEPCATDIEFQNYWNGFSYHPMIDPKTRGPLKSAGQKKYSHRIGWIAIVNSIGERILDCHVKYDDDLERLYPPRQYGVWADRLTSENGAVDAAVVEAWCARIFANRIVVVHGGGHDLTAFHHLQQLGIDPFATSTVWDTQNYYGVRKLKYLAQDFLGISIQVQDKHTAVEDAAATMRLRQRLPQYYYDRVAAQKVFNVRSEAEKNAHLSSFPAVERQHYQSNETPEETEMRLNKSAPLQRKGHTNTRGGRKIGPGRQ